MPRALPSALVLALASGGAAGQQITDGNGGLPAERAPVAASAGAGPVVDDTSWQTANRLDGFVLREPSDGAPAWSGPTGRSLIIKFARQFDIARW